MSEAITVSTFYHFTALSEPAHLRAPLLACMQELGVRGTVTLAGEGVNATISGVQAGLNAFIAALEDTLGIRLANRRDSITGAQPFQRSKVKVKRELISLGAEANPSVCVGQYVAPSAWNALIAAPDVITIDTRNDYEFALGRFAGAVNPGTRNFKDMVRFTEEVLKPQAAGKRVAMYCTGGIRCEKYSAYLVTQGFPQVFHLRGGILAYLKQMPTDESLWEGTCFVFDERVALGYGLGQA